MIPVEQREVYDLAAGLPGDCWKCCIASVLELPYEEVPHFVALEQAGLVSSEWNATQEFLRPRGMVLAQFGLREDAEHPTLQFGNGKNDFRYRFSAPGHWIAGVRSPRVVEEDGSVGLHAVVMHGAEIVWDPHPDRAMGHLGFTAAYLLVKA